MGNGSFTVKDLRLYDETSSSKRRSPAAHAAQNVTCVAAPSIRFFADTNDITLATPGGECQKKCLRDPLGGTHEVVDDGSLFDNNSNYSVTDSV